MLVLETEIRDLCKAICWVTDRLIGQHTVVKGNVQGILILFNRHDDYTFHPLLRNTHMLESYFTNFSVQYICMEGNMHADYIINKGTKVCRRIVWEGSFLNSF